jgi:hypothetical protein
MAIEMCEPIRRAPQAVNEEIQDMILRRGGSTDLARVVMTMNAYARDKGNENYILRHELVRVRTELVRVQAELAELARVQAENARMAALGALLERTW